MPGGRGGSNAMRQRNLQKATATRRAQRALKDAMRDGSVDPYEVLAGSSDREDVARRIKLRRILLMVPNCGEVTADELIDRLGVRSDYRLEAFTYEKREAIANYLRDAIEGTASTQITEPRL